MSSGDHRFGRRGFLSKAGAGVAAVSIAGCIGGDDGDGGGDTEPTPTPTPTSTPPDGSTEHELVYIDVDSLTTIDPARGAGASDFSALINLYDPLFFVEAETFRTIDNLAVDWEVNDEGTRYEITIVDDAVHHNGDPVTAEDVAFSLNRVMEVNESPASVFAGFFEAGNAEAIDGTTVGIDLEIPYGPFLAALTQLFVANADQAADAADDFLQETVAGSGPYVIDDLVEGSRLELQQFEDYWGGWEDEQFERARHEVVTEESTARIMMQQGDADLTSKFLSQDSYDEMEGYDNVEVPVRAELFMWHFPMHTQKPPLDDRHVRKAVAHTFDYDAAVESIFRDGEKAIGPVPVGMPGHNDDLEPYRQDFDLAMQEIEQSAYTIAEINDIGLEIMWTSAVPWEEPIALLLQNGLAEIGITETDSNDTPWPQMLERASDPETTPHFTQVGNTARIASPDWHTYGMYHPSVQGEINAAAWYEDDELTSTLEEARVTFDEQERFDLYREAQAMIHDAYPSVFIANPAYKAGVNDNLGGWEYRGVLSYEHRWYEMHRIGDGRA